MPIMLTHWLVMMFVKVMDCSICCPILAKELVCLDAVANTFSALVEPLVVETLTLYLMDYLFVGLALHVLDCVPVKMSFTFVNLVKFNKSTFFVTFSKLFRIENLDFTLLGNADLGFKALFSKLIFLFSSLNCVEQSSKA